MHVVIIPHSPIYQQPQITYFIDKVQQLQPKRVLIFIYFLFIWHQKVMVCLLSWVLLLILKLNILLVLYLFLLPLGS